MSQMRKNTRYAEIPQLKGVAFSDPFYTADILCQYRRDFNPPSGWVMRMETTRDESGIVEFSLSLGRPTTLSGLKVREDSFGCYGHHTIKDYEIGIDCARVFVGSLDNFEKFGEEASVYTAADGLFGDLHVITCMGEDEPAGFLLLGGIDGDITNEDELFRTITAGFDGHEIDCERFEKLTDPNSLEVRKQLAKELYHAKAIEKGGKPHPEKDRGNPER